MSNPVIPGCSPAASQKNLLINGDFSVWQRGTSFTAPVDYTADRWWCGQGQVDRYDLGAGVYGLRQQGLNVNWVTLRHRFEIHPQWFASKTVTLSFDLLVLSATTDANNTCYIQVRDEIQAPTYQETAIDWTTSGKKVVTFTMPAMTGTDFVELFLVTGNATNRDGDYVFSNIQLELGDTATDFEYVDPATQLARCQRYYEISDAPQSAYSVQTGRLEGTARFAVRKRVVPTIVSTSVGMRTQIDQAYIDEYRFLDTGGGINTANHYIESWTADAEL